MNEKIIKPISGFAMLGFAVLCLVGAAYSFYLAYVLIGILLFIAAIISFMGIIIVNPNESRVLTFFGTYSGTVKANGLFFVNPLYKKQSISLRARNLNGQSLKVNDKMGNPIEIAAVIVWQVEDTAKAAFAVDNYTLYVNIQSEAAVRHLAGSCPYDNLEDENATITLRDGADQVNDMLEHELNERLRPAGITVLEARISHLAYAPEIAGAMLQRQQATAVVAARKQIVEGAVGMVEMALSRLSEREIVHLDEERKAAMVSNLLVVLCAEKSVSPIVNTGTLYN